MSSALLRRIRGIALGVALTITVLGVILVVAAWRDDKSIESDLGRATAEVLSAGPRRSAISFVTPDGATHNPVLGVLYPTRLTVGQRINVEYNKNEPDLVRVAGRDASVAVMPAASVVIITWIIAGAALMLLNYLDNRKIKISSQKMYKV
ncbi:MAG: DUF3592 domain-containing protein [Mycobacteriaceae bacterium]